MTILRPRQKSFVERSLAALDKYNNTLGVAPTGCHAKGTPILMYSGDIKNVEDIRVGDQLMGPDSRPRKVLQLHRGYDQLYEIRPLKGESFIVNHGHILSLVKTNTYNNHRRFWGSPAGSIVNISINSYLNTSPHFKHLHKLYRVSVDFLPKDTPALDPYFLGVLLGDGSLKYGTPSVTTADVEIAGYCQTIADQLQLSLRIEQLSSNEANTYYFSDPSHPHVNRLTDQLRALDLYGCGADKKCIPFDYKTGDRGTRAAILAGLLDTDGYLVRTAIEFSSASKQLANDVAFIARSLGFYALPKPKKVKGKTYYRFTINGDFSEIPLKVARRIPEPRKQKKNPLRTGFTVHSVGKGDYYGFTVDDDNLYVMGDFTVTHNSGKTIMLSAVTGQWLQGTDGKACVLAHRDELTTQNEAKFLRVNPSMSTSVFDATQKSWNGQVTFSMVQTLSRASGLQQIPRLDLLVIDEAHHAAADSYRRVIDTVQERNPNALIYGVTATPNRADRKGLRPIFSNVADQITLSELIKSGHLVPPRTYDIDVGQREALSQLAGSANVVDRETGKLLNTRPTTQSIIQHWKEKAGDRQTIIFCSTVEHARDVAQHFMDAGINTECVHGDLSSSERKLSLLRYESRQSQVVVNVGVLTEGYDYPPTSCVVILRLSSCKSMFLQMIGRGLRTVNPEEYPGITKVDCIVLDFGTSTSSYGRLEEAVDLEGSSNRGEAPTKICPECDAIIPAASQSCSLCGYIFESTTITTKEVLSDFVMTEVDMLNRSLFKWCDLFGDECALLATGFDAWAGLFFLNNQWYALGGMKKTPPKLLSVGERLVCLAAADDFLNTYETEKAATKSKRWLKQAATKQQLQYLNPRYRHDFSLTRYHASCLLAFKFNKRAIQSTIFTAESRQQEAA